MGRKPKGGRNWEGFGADPVLQAVGARETIKGIQEQGVIATIKHFIGNEQEMYRMYNPFQYAYSANIGSLRLSLLCPAFTDELYKMIVPCTSYTYGLLPKASGPE